MTEPKYLDRPLDEPMPDRVLAEILAETQRGLPIDCGMGGRIIAELRATRLRQYAAEDKIRALHDISNTYYGGCRCDICARAASA